MNRMYLIKILDTGDIFLELKMKNTSSYKKVIYFLYERSVFESIAVV